MALPLHSLWMQLPTQWWVMFHPHKVGSATSLHLHQRDPEFRPLLLSDHGRLRRKPDRFVRSIAAADHRPIVDVFQVPREALSGAELSKDYSQRTTLNGLSSFFGWISGAGIAYVTNAHFLGAATTMNKDTERSPTGLRNHPCDQHHVCSRTHRNISELEVPPARAKPKLGDIWQESANPES